MKLDHHLDLTRLAAGLAQQKLHRPLVGAVKSAADIGSIRDDLRNAASSLRIIREMADRAIDRPDVLDGEDEQAVVAGALFTSAVILYSRATFASPNRSSLGDEVLSTDEKETHDEVKELRNTTFAHFGIGEAAKEGPIVREAVVRSFNLSPHQYRYGVYTMRALHKVELGARLERLIEARLEQVMQKQQRLLDAVEAKLMEALGLDATLKSQLTEFRFDVDAFCASSAAADRMREMLADGTAEDGNYTTAVRKP